MLSFNEWLGVEPELRLSEWLSLAVMAPLVCGAAFQTPLVMVFLERTGIVQVELYTKNRKMAFFLLAIVAAFLAAAPDALNMGMLAVPLWALYEFGTVLCRFAPGVNTMKAYLLITADALCPACLGLSPVGCCGMGTPGR